MSGRSGKNSSGAKNSFFKHYLIKTIRDLDALAAVRELFHVGYWLAHTYARGAKPAPGLAFDLDRLKPELPTLGVPP